MTCPGPGESWDDLRARGHTTFAASTAEDLAVGSCSGSAPNTSFRFRMTPNTLLAQQLYNYCLNCHYCGQHIEKQNCKHHLLPRLIQIHILLSS